MPLAKPKTCENCILETKGRGFSTPDGTCANGVLIIGESLGAKEVLDAKPFRPYAEAGSLLNSAIRRSSLNLQREDFLFFNMIQCQPPFNKLENTSYEYEAIRHCRIHLKAVIDQYKPKVILAVGNVPVKHLRSLEEYGFADYLIETESLSTKSLPEDLEDNFRKQVASNKKLAIGSIRGYKFETIYGIPMIASFHPSFITRTGRVFTGVLINDLETAVMLARGEWREFTTNYIESPTLKEAEEFYALCKANPNKPISYDIETPRTSLIVDESEIEDITVSLDDIRDIKSIQFSLSPGTAIFLNWTDDFIEIARKVLKLPNDKLSWNGWKLDSASLKYHLGDDAIAGENIDVLWCWKWLNQDFKKTGKALQFAVNFVCKEFPAWKHHSEDEPTWYGCLDVDAVQRLYLTLKATLSSRRLDNNSKTLWEGFVDDVLKLKPILDDMSRRGIPTDLIAREELDKEISKEIKKTQEELKKLYPFELRNIDPKEGYRNVPKEVIEFTEIFEQKYREFAGENYSIIIDLGSSNGSNRAYNLALSKFIEANTRRVTKTNKIESGLILKGFKIIEGRTEKRWCRVEEFKPNSSDQVLRYIAFMAKKDKRYVIPKKKGDRKQGKFAKVETSSKDEIYQLFEKIKDPLLEKVIYIRELNKMLKTYVRGWFKNIPDGRIHPEFTFIPANGQLSARRPNVQNQPKRGTRFSSKGYVKLADKFNRIIAAGNGKVLLSPDWKSFHALILGFHANDSKYIRVVQKDIHSYVASYILQSELPNRLIQLKMATQMKLNDMSKWKALNNERELVEETLEWLSDIASWLDYSDDILENKLKWIGENWKFIRNEQAKRAVHGINYGEGPNKLYSLNTHSFKNVNQADKLIRLIKSLFPEIFSFQDSVVELADLKTYLITPYGYIRRFWDVYDWRLLDRMRSPKNINEKIIKDKHGKWWSRNIGTQGEEAKAYFPANGAFGLKKEVLRCFREHDIDKKYCLVNEIHDSFIFEINENEVDTAVPLIKGIMESPSKVLKSNLFPLGLSCQVDIKIGRTMGEMRNYKL
jgi:uracil-DNA glycosylase family 4